MHPLIAHTRPGISRVVHVVLRQENAITNSREPVGVVERLLAKDPVFGAHRAQQAYGLYRGHPKDEQHAGKARDQDGSQSTHLAPV